MVGFSQKVIIKCDVVMCLCIMSQTYYKVLASLIVTQRLLGKTFNLTELID